ncbi:hypothetical protein HT031_005544 [Scenedesmus sp. PABB004]|nr:hypothetical protein HT031_005544 [Scenedesmus sp. PABB004]
MAPAPVATRPSTRAGGRCGAAVARAQRCRPRLARAVAAAAPRAVTAQETFDASSLNMPELPGSGVAGYGGRWERWAPPPGGDGEWALVHTGQSAYAFAPSPGGGALTVHVMEARDAAPTPIAECGSGGARDGGGGGGGGGGEVLRATNQFSVGDPFFSPCLPGPEGAAGQSPAAALRLWAADANGFAMAPARLPAALTAPGAAAARRARSRRSLPTYTSSLRLTMLTDLEAELRPGGERTAPPPAGGDGADALLTRLERGDLPGVAVEFSYDDAGGHLLRRDVPRCTWADLTPRGAGGGGATERWYSSGGYTRAPADLAACLAAGRHALAWARQEVYGVA